jgi:hypothetical protein
MKSQLLVFIFLLASLSGIQAQKPQAEDITNKQRAKSFIDHIAPKLEITKSQKDSLITIFADFMDEVEKYRAGNNAKIITYLMKSRDEKVKTLLHSDAKYDKYLLTMADIQKQREPQQAPSQQPPQGGQHQMGGGQNDGPPRGD